MNNQLSIEEGNRLIAEFVGKDVMGYFNTEPFVTNVTFPASEIESYRKMGATIILNYHSSWDWLMPVVEKIQSIDITPPPNYKGYRIEIVVQGYVRITGFSMPSIFTNVSIEGSLIAAVWKAVIQFIQWYNSQPKNK